MGASKIVNETEVLRWFEENRTYAWMVEEYRRKYGIETSPAMWGNFRRRRGIDRRLTRDVNLIPWAIKPEHRWAYPVMMLRAEGRLREGKELPAPEASRLATWKQMLEEEDAVVHYDPDTEDGFHYIHRQPGEDLIHPPAQVTGRRPVD
jgi:hypothetical protein